MGDRSTMHIHTHKYTRRMHIDAQTYPYKCIQIFVNITQHIMLKINEQILLHNSFMPSRVGVCVLVLVSKYSFYQQIEDILGSPHNVRTLGLRLGFQVGVRTGFRSALGLGG